MDTLRIFLHVLGAAVWVGGQVVMGGLVGPARRHDAAVPRVLAKGFGRVAWPAYFLTVLTGMWSLIDFRFAEQSAENQITLFVKIFLAVLAGMFAVVHMIGKTRRAIAIGGALGLLCSLGALFLGVLLRTAV